jgi:RNA polymerase sigma factor (sigma-70 family)
MTKPLPVSGENNPENGLDSTVSLLARFRAGDETARDRLLSRYLPVLRRWAHGRLPSHARQLADTDDLVQITLIRALNHMESFEPSREGAFLLYLRRILMNALRDEIRRSRLRPSSGEPEAGIPDPGRSALEELIGNETIDRYEAALAELTEEQREAVVLRIEFDFKHEQIAQAIGKPTANAARMLVSRALLRVAETMCRETT